MASTATTPSSYPLSSSTSPPSSSSSSPSYEIYAPRSTSQRARLARIEALTAGPSAPSSTSSSSSNAAGITSSAGGGPSSIMTTSSLLLQAMLPPPPSSSSNYDFVVSSTTSSASEEQDPIDRTLAEALVASDHLTSLLKHTTSLRLALRASVNIAEDLSKRHADLLRHSGELSAEAERLQAEEAMLSHHAEEIGMPLKHYDAVDAIGPRLGVLFKDGGKTVVRGLSRLKVDAEEFPSTLDEIDFAIEFFGERSGGREALRQRAQQQQQQEQQQQRGGEGPSLQSGAAEYYKRSIVLHDAALDLIREAVAERIKTTTSDVAAALNIPKVPVPADKLEASLVYTRFHGISSRSNRLITLVKQRQQRSESYGELLQLCRNTYCGCRENLLKATVRSHMDKLRERHGLVGMTRLASVFLIRLCTVETALYLDFFGDKDKLASKGKKKDDDGDETKAVEEEGTGRAQQQQQQRLLRKKPSSSSEADAATLASQVLATDGTYQHPEFQSYLTTLCSSLHRTVRRGLVTVHDLDTLCQIVSVLREEMTLANSSPTTIAAARAVSSIIYDAQERLIFCANGALTREVLKFKPTPADLDYPDKLRRLKEKATVTGGEGEEETKSGSTALTTSTATDDAVQAQMRVYESWFPPMRSVLRILSKIFRVVEPKVFEDIALQSVQACTGCLKEASTFILKKSGVMHSDLFLVKHLLILREQLSPFDVQLRAIERQLDFSDAGKAVSRFLANRNRRLFAMSTENAILTLLREGVSVQESPVDSKRDLEDALRSACNDFIEHTSSSVAGPILTFVEQCRSASASSGESLKAQSFMSGERVRSFLMQTQERLEVQMGEVTTQMGLYLENPATQSILLKPVVRKVTRALDEAKRYVGETVDGEFGWDATLRSEVARLMQEIETGLKKTTAKSSSR